MNCVLDDHINDMIQAMKDHGVQGAQIRRTLELLGEAEDLNAELEATLIPSQKVYSQGRLRAAMIDIFK